MNRHTVCASSLLLLTGLIWSPGCRFLRSGVAPGDFNAYERHAAAGDSASSFGRRRDAGKIRVVVLYFDIARAALPLGDVQHSRKVWNHVDELRLDAALSGELRRNGLRAGVASADAWPSIQAIFDATGATVRRERRTMQGHEPLPIEVGVIRGDESIFYYEPTGRLAGKTFNTGTKQLTVDYAYHPELGDRTELKVNFEIRHDRGVLRWEKRAGTFTPTPAVDRHVYRDLEIGVILKPGEMLVIGLDDATRSAYLLGQRFMSFQRDGARFETLLFVAPGSSTWGGPAPPAG